MLGPPLEDCSTGFRAIDIGPCHGVIVIIVSLIFGLFFYIVFDFIQKVFLVKSVCLDDSSGVSLRGLVVTVMIAVMRRMMWLSWCPRTNQLKFYIVRAI